MTQLNDTQTSENAPAHEPRAYAAPALTTLGTIDALTAGPNSGSLDQLVGAGGGFQDATS